MFAKEIQKITRRHALAIVSVLALVLSIAPAGMAGPVAADGGVTFTLNAPDAQAVFLAGDFNGWNASDLPLANDGAGNWSVTVPLAAGAYEYKFVVDDQWQEDPGNAQKKSDPFGGSNSLVTVQANGSLAGGAVAVAAPTAVKPAAVDMDEFSVGAPKAVEGGIAFTYEDGGATNVTLAGTFNGWNADDSPLANDGSGKWIVVKPLDAGQHEYKFVVDGNWLADAQNPETISDPYGGVNSVITVDADGQLIATVGASSGGSGGDSAASNNTLNAKVTIDGRYLTRFEYAKNVPVDVGDESLIDPRFRLQRPTQSVDLNFHTEVSEVARTFMRLRLDSDQNIIQNNVAAFLDEAHLEITPENFTLTAYWNQEIFTGEDLLKLGGDIDLPGTILHDHVDFGKGSAGALFLADPVGIRTRLFFANVHNFDYYNDPDLFDNIGEDKISLRFSREVGKFEIGAPMYAERALIWLDFGSLVSLPSTGIPVLDEHRANTGDTSTWYEVDNFIFNGGLDLTYHASEKWTVGGEALFRNATQRFATGNESGQNNTNGAMDLPFLERDEMLYVGQIDYQPSENSKFKLQHQISAMTGGDPDQRLLSYSFLPQELANKQVFFSIGDSPAVADKDSTELTWNWQREHRSASLWLRRASRDFDYSAVGLNAPEDSTVSSHTADALYLAGSVGMGQTSDRFGHFELEAGYNLADRGVAGLKRNQLEMIFRYDRDLTRNTGFIADLRFTSYHLESDGAESTDTDYFNPFVGFRYTPIKKLELVAAYGIDPMDYSIEYGGRQTGRWNYRQTYLFDHPGATDLDAENFLKTARVITLRAQLLF